MLTTTSLTPISTKNTFMTKKDAQEEGIFIGNGFAMKPPKLNKSFIPKRTSAAQIVSFKEELTDGLSSIYNIESSASYLDQCFHNITKMGEGSFGVVFKAQSIEDGRYYAIKKSKGPFRGKWDKKAKLNEVRKYERIPQHPFCVQMKYAWTQDDYLFLLMELCDRNLLSYACEHDNIPEPKIWLILFHMLMAVKNLHDSNLLHLDIKLENILMCGDDVFKLGDFGLVTDINASDCVEGDSKYLAPEVLDGYITKAADVFSLGMVILELASDLVLPKDGFLWHELRSNHLPDSYLKGRSPELVNLVKQMVQRDFSKRPTVDDLLALPRFKKMMIQHKLSQYINTLTQRCIVNNYRIISQYLNYYFKLPMWLLAKIARNLLNPTLLPPQGIRSTNDVVTTENQNIFTMPMANSTPKNIGGFLSRAELDSLSYADDVTDRETFTPSIHLSPKSTSMKRKRNATSSVKRKLNLSHGLVGRELFPDNTI